MAIGTDVVIIPHMTIALPPNYKMGDEDINEIQRVVEDHTGFYIQEFDPEYDEASLVYQKYSVYPTPETQKDPPDDQLKKALADRHLHILRREEGDFQIINLWAFEVVLADGLYTLWTGDEPRLARQELINHACREFEAETSRIVRLKLGKELEPLKRVIVGPPEIWWGRPSRTYL